MDPIGRMGRMEVAERRDLGGRQFVVRWVHQDRTGVTVVGRRILARLSALSSVEWLLPSL